MLGISECGIKRSLSPALEAMAHILVLDAVNFNIYDLARFEVSSFVSTSGNNLRRLMRWRGLRQALRDVFEEE